MSKITHIKPFYKPAYAQADLREDGINLFTNNMTANFKTYEKRFMTKKEIDKLTRLFYNKLIEANINEEWNQTS
mgnify:CR=1 FL=1